MVCYFVKLSQTTLKTDFPSLTEGNERNLSSWLRKPGDIIFNAGESVYTPGWRGRM